jgi:MoaA/NifB/PqqE/SkfB family radical SAM enzyme
MQEQTLHFIKNNPNNQNKNPIRLFFRALKKILKKTSLYSFYDEIRFERNFKKFDHGDEFKDYICTLPFEYGELTNPGDISVCCYLPKNIGNVQKQGFKGAWNSYTAKNLRKSMLDGSFAYCDKKRCRSMQYKSANVIKKDQIEDVRLKKMVDNSLINLSSDLKILSLGNDYSCNLECPSCRSDIRIMKKDEVDVQIKRFNALMAEVGPFLSLIHIAGDGDPFASQFYHHIITKTDWDKFPFLKIRFQTNGNALTSKKWNSLPSTVRTKVSEIGISIDGATSPTYNRLRLGGEFDALVENIKFLSKMPERSEHGIKLNLNMIVQNGNYKEMLPLISLGESWGVDTISFTYLSNWGTFEEKIYLDEAIHLPSHPDHHEFIELLKHSKFKEPHIDLGNLHYLAI